MKLCHFSTEEMLVIDPKNGSNRQHSEDPKILGKPVVFLTDSPKRAPGVVYRANYRYTVEIDDNDPSLHKDRSKESLKSV